MVSRRGLSLLLRRSKAHPIRGVEVEVAGVGGGMGAGALDAGWL